MSDVVIPEDESDEDESEEHDERWAKCPFCGRWLQHGTDERCSHLLCDPYAAEGNYRFWNCVIDFEDDAEDLCLTVADLKDYLEHNKAKQDLVRQQIVQAPATARGLLVNMLLRESYQMQDFVGLFADHAHEWADDWGSGCFYFAADAQAAGEKLQAAVKETLGWIEKHIETE